MKRIVAIALVTLQCAAIAAGDPSAGQRLYESGMRADGSQLEANGIGQTHLAGEAAACAKCHRRSGMGSHEGETIVPPITGPRLFAAPIPALLPRHRGPTIPLRADSRAAYVGTSLLRAITAGVDSSGRTLDDLMPRYLLHEPDSSNLLAFLEQLGSMPEAGVSANRLHLATIIAPDAAPGRRKAVESVLRGWAERDGLSNLEIDLDVWQLAGSADTWGDQLRSHYRAAPVFAVISGAGAREWTPVVEFCEAVQVPCVFPIVDSASNADAKHFSFFLDAGLPLEARLLARHFANTEHGGSRVIQFVQDEQARQAADILAAALPGRQVLVRQWSGEASQATDIGTADIVVAWLARPELELLLKRLVSAMPVTYASSRMAPPDSAMVPSTLRSRIRWISTRLEPSRLAAHRAAWVRPWLTRIGVVPQDAPEYSELYVALQFFNEALARMRGNWNREYLLESLESGMYNRPAGRVYFSLSLAPGQRWAVKGGHILGLQPPDHQMVVPVSERLVP